LEIVEIRAGYLLKYLQARQMSLVIGQYRQLLKLLLFNPAQSTIRKFMQGDLTLGTAEQGAKAILRFNIPNQSCRFNMPSILLLPPDRSMDRRQGKVLPLTRLPGWLRISGIRRVRNKAPIMPARNRAAANRVALEHGRVPGAFCC
jgi:hypothetical protein